MSVQRSMPTRSEIEPALCRAGIYWTLSQGFSPVPKRGGNSLGAAELCALSQAATLLDAERGGDLSAAAGRVQQARRTWEPAALAAQFARLFGHTACAAVPAYETEYQLDGPFLQPQQLADVAGFYRAFGLRSAPAVHERVDHISCQCEFMGFLGRKEAFAIEHDDAAMLAATRSAQRQFLRDHLGRFAPAFAARVQRQDPGGFFGGLAELLLAYVRAECEAFGVRCGPELLELRRGPEAEVPMACGGSCSLAAGAPGAGE